MRWLLKSLDNSICTLVHHPLYSSLPSSLSIGWLVGWWIFSGLGFAILNWPRAFFRRLLKHGCFPSSSISSLFSCLYSIRNLLQSFSYFCQQFLKISSLFFLLEFLFSLLLLLFFCPLFSNLDYVQLLSIFLFHAFLLLISFLFLLRNNWLRRFNAMPEWKWWWFPLSQTSLPRSSPCPSLSHQG